VSDTLIGSGGWRSLNAERPFDAAHALAYLAARAVPGLEHVREDGVYRRTLTLPHGPAILELRLAADRADIRLPACDARDRCEAATRARRLLGLDQDLRPARAALAGDPHLGPLIRKRPGLRVPGGADDFELLIRAIVHQQVSLAAARTVLGRLIEEHGARLSRHTEERLFPSRATLSALDPADLPMPRARARAIIAAAARTSTDDVESIPGVGTWTASYFAMRARRDPDAFPRTDLGIRRALERLGNPDPERWRPFRAYAAQHLWASALR
jgi:AraC family transcriptional regulator of adaptative response / DNA-3-methyladenine glycosylase II